MAGSLYPHILTRAAPKKDMNHEDHQGHEGNTELLVLFVVQFSGRRIL
jgi:hypothetical protein